MEGPVYAPKEQFFKTELVVSCFKIFLRAFGDNTFKNGDKIIAKMFRFEETTFNSEFEYLFKVIQAKVLEEGVAFNIGLEERFNESLERMLELFIFSCKIFSAKYFASWRNFHCREDGFN